MANGNDDLKIINMSDPFNPVPVGSIKTDGDDHGVSTSTMEIGGIIYELLTNNKLGLKIIDMSNP